MRGRLRVAGRPGAPFLRPCLFQNTRAAAYDCARNGGGTNHELLEGLAKQLGFRGLAYALAPREKMPDPTRPANWTGVLGMLARNETDAGAALMFLDSPSQLLAADFSLPIVTISRGLVMGTPSRLGSGLMSQTVVWPFSPPVWEALIAVILLVCALSAVFLVFEAQVGAIRHAHHLFAVFLALEGFFVFRYYKCNFYVTRVSKDGPSLPFTDIQGFTGAIWSGAARYVSSSYDGSSLSFINRSELRSHQDLAAALRARSIHILARDTLVTAISDHPGEFVTIMSASQYDGLTKTFCNLTFIPLSLGVRFLAFPFRKASGLADLANSGLYGGYWSPNDAYRIFEHRYVYASPCLEHIVVLEPLRFAEINTALLYYGALLSLGPLSAFFAELAWERVKGRDLLGSLSMAAAAFGPFSYSYHVSRLR